MRTLALALIVAAATAATAASCGLSVAGEGSALDDAGIEAAVDAADAGDRDGAVPETPDGAATDATPLDATPPRDATFDAPETLDAAADGGCAPGSFRCGATCVASCLGCTAGNLSCPTTLECTTTCAGCPGRAFECWTCEATRRDLTKATCTTGIGAGAGGCYGGPTATHCDCGDGCFGAQICVKEGGEYSCRGCGEPGTNGATCATGARCSAGELTCR